MSLYSLFVSTFWLAAWRGRRGESKVSRSLTDYATDLQNEIMSTMNAVAKIQYAISVLRNDTLHSPIYRGKERPSRHKLKNKSKKSNYLDIHVLSNTKRREHAY